MRPFKNGIGYSKNTAIYDHHCLWCGTHFTGSMDKTYCAPACRLNAWRARQRNENPQPKLGKVPGYYAWGTLRFAVLERDGFRCRYCGRGHKENVVLHVDHFHPRVQGGSDDLDNLLTACSECNLSKGGRLVTTKPD